MLPSGRRDDVYRPPAPVWRRDVLPDEDRVDPPVLERLPGPVGVLEDDGAGPLLFAGRFEQLRPRVAGHGHLDVLGGDRGRVVQRGQADDEKGREPGDEQLDEQRQHDGLLAGQREDVTLRHDETRVAPPRPIRQGWSPP